MCVCWMLLPIVVITRHQYYCIGYLENKDIVIFNASITSIYSNVSIFYEDVN